MKPTFLRAIAFIQFFLAAAAGLVFAQADPTVMCRTNTTLLQQNGEWVPLAEDLEMPHGIKVFTNGTFQINEGKIRIFKEGQILRADGFLLNLDGSTMPAVDHISMQGGVTVYKDGEGVPPAGSITLADGTVVNSDGSYIRPGGRASRLIDGQNVGLDGAAINGLDTISLKNGRVAVFKGGAPITLESAPNIILGMSDGKRVSGDGVVTELDGSRKQLTEGETIFVPGVRADW